MATPSVPDPPYETKTDDFGQLLQEKYSDKDLNTSINYFMIMLGKPVSKLLEATPGHPTSEPPAINEEEFSEMLKRIGFDFFSFTEKGWNAQKLFAFKHDENSGSNERDQEEEINLSIREDLKKNLKKVLHDSSLPPLPDIGIIFTRACLYVKEPREIPTTNTVGAVLKSKYKCPAGDTPTDYFYLIIQEESGYKLNEEAVKELELLPGKWREMNKKDWPGLFIGHYPKEPFLTEREREWSLNTKVRERLIENLTKKIEEKKADENFQAKVHVIITRACVYTACEEEQPSACTVL